MDRESWLNTDWLAEYEGLSLAAALSLAQTHGRPARVIHPNEPVTADLNRQRLNVYVDELGALIRVRAG